MSLDASQEVSIYALFVRSLTLSQAIQEIDLKVLEMKTECLQIPVVVSMHYSDGQLLCTTGNGLFYLFSVCNPGDCRSLL